MPKKSRLCYFGCRSDGPLHHFPKVMNGNCVRNVDMEKFNTWKAVLDQDIQNRGDHYIYHNITFCERHFEAYYRLPSRRLTKNAVPTLYLDVNPAEKQSLNESSQIGEEQIVMASCGMLRNEDDDKTTFLESEQTPSDEHTNVPLECAMDADIRFETTPCESKSEQPSTSIIPHKLGIDSRELFQLDYRDKLIFRLKQKLEKVTLKYKSLKKKIGVSQEISRSLSNRIERLPDNIRTFTKLQLKCAIKPRGRRFTHEEKKLALKILRESPKAYKLLKDIFVLPSKRCLKI